MKSHPFSDPLKQRKEDQILGAIRQAILPAEKTAFKSIFAALIHGYDELFYSPKNNVACCHNLKEVYEPINREIQSTFLSLEKILDHESDRNHCLQRLEQIKPTLLNMFQSLLAFQAVLIILEPLLDENIPLKMSSPFHLGIDVSFSEQIDQGVSVLQAAFDENYDTALLPWAFARILWLTPVQMHTDSFYSYVKNALDLLYTIKNHEAAKNFTNELSAILATGLINVPCPYFTQLQRQLKDLYQNFLSNTLDIKNARQTFLICRKTIQMHRVYIQDYQAFLEDAIQFLQHAPALAQIWDDDLQLKDIYSTFKENFQYSSEDFNDLFRPTLVQFYDVAYERITDNDHAYQQRLRSLFSRIHLENLEDSLRARIQRYLLLTTYYYNQPFETKETEKNHTPDAAQTKLRFLEDLRAFYEKKSDPEKVAFQTLLIYALPCPFTLKETMAYIRNVLLSLTEKEASRIVLNLLSFLEDPVEQLEASISFSDHMLWGSSLY